VQDIVSAVIEGDYAARLRESMLLAGQPGQPLSEESLKESSVGVVLVSSSIHEFLLFTIFVSLN
jgi:hypothetical protein